MSLATFWAIISQSHLVILLERQTWYKILEIQITVPDFGIYCIDIAEGEKCGKSKLYIWLIFSQYFQNKIFATFYDPKIYVMLLSEEM
jgi:hypothetical protein